jgi:hypothetical protein
MQSRRPAGTAPYSLLRQRAASFLLRPRIPPEPVWRPVPHGTAATGIESGLFTRMDHAWQSIYSASYAAITFDCSHPDGDGLRLVRRDRVTVSRRGRPVGHALSMGGTRGQGPRPPSFVARSRTSTRHQSPWTDVDVRTPWLPIRPVLLDKVIRMDSTPSATEVVCPCHRDISNDAKLEM